MSQNDQVLKLLKNGPVTPLDALREVDCLRLAARVWDLRSKGHSIVTDMITKGDKTYAQYRLNGFGTG